MYRLDKGVDKQLVDVNGAKLEQGSARLPAISLS